VRRWCILRDTLVFDSGGHFGSVFPSGLWEHWVFIGLALHLSSRHERIVSMGTADVTIASGDKLSQWLRISNNELAKKHAAKTLRKNADGKNWSNGNIIHNANQILGCGALREGKLADAKTYLFKAVATPGSPQLNSFGPEMQLARELLE
jgi:hypothetical protein